MADGQEVTFQGENRSLDGYLALPKPATERRGAIVVIHEIFGPDAHIRGVAQRFAAEGYVALAPNLFTGELQQVLTPTNIGLAMKAFAEAPSDLRSNPERFRQFAASQPAERRPILEAFVRVSSPPVQAGFARDLVGATTFLRERPEVDPTRVGCVGFCFGGAMSALLATEDPLLRAAIIFYGQHPPLDRVAGVHAAVLGLYGGEDPGITQKVPEFAEAMGREGKRFEYHVYPGAKHAFFNDTRPNYHRESAEDAWKRATQFLARELGPPRTA